jgi:nitroreductase
MTADADSPGSADPADGSAPAEPRPALAALRARRSFSRVTDRAPSRAELEEIVAAMASVQDHSRLRPWRLIELRGDDRRRLGKALAKAGGGSKKSGIGKAERAPLVLAVVVSPRKSKKVPRWEQEAVAAGVAHFLGLLLHEAGWGSIWRTGSATRAKAVHRAHGLDRHEYLLGWLYVGGIPQRDRKPKPRKPLDLSRHLGTL